MGLELAEYFKGHEVLIATHLDNRQLHNHFIINSVSFETGLKLQEGPDSLFKLRKLSDEICLAHNLLVLPPYSHSYSETKGLNAREYRAAEKGESWKFRLIGAIDQSMAVSRTKTEFIDNMAVLGYQVNWTANRQHITYTTPDGKKCRDNKLHEDKYLKERMEGYFLELSRTKEQEYAGGNSAGRGSSVETLLSNGLRNTARTMGGHNYASVGTARDDFRNAGVHGLPADAGVLERQSRPGASENGPRPLQGNHGMSRRPESLDGTDKISNGGANGKHNEGYSRAYAGDKLKLERKSQGAGFIARQPAAEMDRRWRGWYDSMLGADESPEPDLKPDLQGKEQQKRIKHEQPKQQIRRKVRNYNREDDWDMER